jgi:hypothetical protein
LRRIFWSKKNRSRTKNPWNAERDVEVAWARYKKAHIRYLYELAECRALGVHGGKLYAKKFVARTGTILASTAYNLAAMQWLRVRQSAAVTYWEYAANYQGPWIRLFQQLIRLC